MYFAVFEVVPNPSSEAAGKRDGGHAACWVNSTDWKAAKTRASMLLSRSGWAVGKIVEEKEVSAEAYASDDPAREYFEQAIMDDEVCVVFTFRNAEERAKKGGKVKAQVKKR